MVLVRASGSEDRGLRVQKVSGTEFISNYLCGGLCKQASVVLVKWLRKQSKFNSDNN